MIEHKDAKVLEAWVFAHSTKISRAQARLIVKSTLDTKLPLLMLALACHESQGFDPTAVSKAGAVGLTQVMPGIHLKSLIETGIIKEPRDLFNISLSMKAGYFILQANLKRTKGDVPAALGLYLGDKDKLYVLKILSYLSDLYYLTETANETM
jgi:soluble lytic murein transglycosylase-like protein